VGGTTQTVGARVPTPSGGPARARPGGIGDGDDDGKPPPPSLCALAEPARFVAAARDRVAARAAAATARARAPVMRRRDLFVPRAATQVRAA